MQCSVHLACAGHHILQGVLGVVRFGRPFLPFTLLSLLCCRRCLSCCFPFCCTFTCCLPILCSLCNTIVGVCNMPFIQAHSSTTHTIVLEGICDCDLESHTEHSYGTAHHTACYNKEDAGAGLIDFNERAWANMTGLVSSYSCTSCSKQARTAMAAATSTIWCRTARVHRRKGGERRGSSG